MWCGLKYLDVLSSGEFLSVRCLQFWMVWQHEFIYYHEFKEGHMQYIDIVLCCTWEWGMIFFYLITERGRVCDERITCPRSPTDCPRSSNWSKTECFMEAAKDWIGLWNQGEKEEEFYLLNIESFEILCLLCFDTCFTIISCLAYSSNKK
jgi:hypothetical protein